MNELGDLQKGSIILVDKPLGWSSFDVVNKLRLCLKYATGIKRYKVGHAGTLDPLATGLLIIAFGKCTKQLTALMGQTKEYVAQIKLGAITDSYDAETTEKDIKPFDQISKEQIEEALQKFSGEILQRPPVFSAKRVNGKRAYLLARAGERPVMPPNLVEIYEIELSAMSLPEITVRVVCSKGTYIRSLAHDLGQALGCGAYLSGLRRTRNGEFLIADAHTPEYWVEQIQALPKSS